MHETVVGLRIGEQSWNEICADQDALNRCKTYGVTQFWSNDRAAYNSQVSTLSDLIAAISASTYPDGSAVNRDIVFGDFEVDSNDNIMNAAGIAQYYSVGADRVSRVAGLEWELKFIEQLEKENPGNGVDLFYRADRSVDDELARSVGGDIGLLIIKFTIMFSFTCGVLTRKFNAVDSRILLSLSGIIFILLSLISGYGFCCALGIPFNSLHMVLPFIVIGIGIDDILVLTAAFDHLSEDLSVSDRLEIAMRRCGMSVTYTTLTDVAAFMLGASSALPAIQAFCLYAAFSLLFNYCFQMTGYAALLCLDAKRRALRKLDILPFISLFSISQRTIIAIQEKQETEALQVQVQGGEKTDVESNTSEGSGGD